MEIAFYGACKTVTGSCHLVKTKDTNLLIDCGLYQGSKALKERNYGDFPFDVEDIDMVVLTHAHIDHSGLLPKLIKMGYAGPVITTKATMDLCSIMLPDSGYIQELEVERKNRKLARADQPLLEAIYTHFDANAAMLQFRALDYGLKVALSPTITVRFNDAGHILGSAIVEIWVDEGEGATKIVFSGDIGNNHQPMIRPPAIIDDADYLVMESTYGSRKHNNLGDRKELLLEAIKDTFKRGGNVVIPAFAVERTQDILFYLATLELDGRLPECNIYVDSPLAISATEIFQVSASYFDDDAKTAFKRIWQSPEVLDKINMVRTQEESRKLNEEKTGNIIISASGMCEAGRIKHHLKHNLWRPESSVVFVGYQAEGTLGRQIVDGKPLVRIHGEYVAVKAKIYNIEGFSGHADQDELVRWISDFTKRPKKVFLVHGESEAMDVLRSMILSEIGCEVIIPEWKQVFDVTKDHIRHIDTFEFSPKETEKLYKDVLNRLTNMYDENLKSHAYHELYSKLKNIEKAL